MKYQVSIYIDNQIKHVYLGNVSVATAYTIAKCLNGVLVILK